MIKDFVLETSNAPGTATTINLAGPVADRVAFASVFANGAPIFYFMDDGAQAEWGAGVFNAGTPNTITRTTVLGNTANTVTRLNFLGTTRVYCEVPSARVAYIDNAGEIRASGFRLSTSLALFTSDATYTQLFFDSGSWRLRYTRSNGVLAYVRGGDNVPLFTIDGGGNVSWPGTATISGSLTVSGGATISGGVTFASEIKAPTFRLTTGSGYLSADANVTDLVFDTALWRLRYTRANGTLTYMRGSDNATMFSVDGGGTVYAPLVQSYTFRLMNGGGYFSADNNWSYLTFDGGGWRWQYQRSTGNITYTRGSDGATLFQVDPSGNVYWPGAGTASGAFTAGGTIQTNGGRIMSYGGSNPSVFAQYPGYAGGMWCESGGNISFGFGDGAGVPSDTRAYIRRSDGIFIVASTCYSGGETSGDTIMSRSGIFRVASNNAYRFERRSDGVWQIVEAGVPRFSVDGPSGNFYGQELHAAGNSFVPNICTTQTSYPDNWGWWASGSTLYQRMSGNNDWVISTNPSDERAKQDIAPSRVDCLDLVGRLSLHEFRAREMRHGLFYDAEPDAELVPVGFVAQRVAEVFPSAVLGLGVVGPKRADGSDAEIIMNIDPSRMMAALAGAVQQLTERVIALEALVTKGTAT